MTAPLTDSRLSNVGAGAILAGFESYTMRFRVITRRASVRFADRDWHGTQSDAVERLNLYREVVDGVVPTVTDLLGDRLHDGYLWVAIKAVYSALISGRDDWELAETFFNSITRRLFDTVGVDERFEFVDTDYDTPPTRSADPVFVTFGRSESVDQLVESILTHFAAGFRQLSDDAAAVARRIERRLEQVGALTVVERTEMVRSVFYRGQSAYLVGNLFSGSDTVPIAIALNHAPDGLFVDAVLLSENELSILFSFTRSYFHVDTARPYDLVRYLKKLMPRKRVAEIYIAIGQNKHGKTELYRDLLRHLRVTTEQFELARGTKGLVMIVFTMPGYPDVFKIIRDRFPPPKRTTRRAIMDKYRLVFQHDRAGRLMDVQDFQHLAFDRARFSDDLLDELLSEAAGTVRVDGDTVVISHVYVERRVIPLDIYVREASEAAATDAVLDFGRAIKDLASSNIFPGDLLLKNFGVTRHGRVVFYDYDELTALTDMTFRAIPPARDDLDEMAADPWYSVAETDVFPEEHERFLGLQPRLKKAFVDQHADLFAPGPWRAIQDRIEAGELIEVFPYGRESRLPGLPGSRGW